MSRFYDLYGLNREFIPENEYTATETNLFSTGNYIPLSILSYIKKYITLPFEELARYGFSQNAGAPNYRNDRSMKRLRDRVKQFIDFVFYHEWKHHHQNISNVRDYLIAIIYPCIINEMIAHCEKENNAQRRAFFIKETIRMFHPPHSHFDSEAFYLDGKLVYDAIDKDIDLIIQMSESERKEWLSTILATPRIPLSDTSQWKRLLAMGSEIYGTHDVLGEMQDEYETEFETRDTGGGPLTVYGTTKSSIPVTIYGEEHVLTSNTFYRSNHFTKRTDYTVWVEHDALQCSVTEQDKHMFYKSKGLEWVWYRRVTLGLPVECIDIRIKIGLPQPWKEDALRFVVGIPTLYNKPEAYEIQHQYIQQYRLNEPTGFLAYVENMMTIYRTAVAEIMNVSLSDSYRYYMTALEEQIATITSIVTKDKPLVSILVVDKDAEDYEDRVEPTRIDSTIFHEEQKKYNTKYVAISFISRRCSCNEST